MLAACLLHDVNWRAHPDYRAELCFELVTRANIAGIDHAERVFLGLALLNRYKAVAPAEEVSRYGGLLPPERAAEAAVLGRAMRLGAMLSGAAMGVLEQSTIAPARTARCVLTLTGPAREFAGEAVERRLQTLAARLDCAAEIVLRDALTAKKRPATAGRFYSSPPDLGQRQRVVSPGPDLLPAFAADPRDTP